MFALGGEDDLVRLLARVTALQAFVETGEGANLLAGYKRAANILKKEKWDLPRVMASRGEQGIPQTGEEDPLSEIEEPAIAEAVAEMAQAKAVPADAPAEEKALVAALDAAEPKAKAAVEAEDFTAAMAALASLRAPIDVFFDKVTVNDPDKADPGAAAQPAGALPRRRSPGRGLFEDRRLNQATRLAATATMAEATIAPWKPAISFAPSCDKTTPSKAVAISPPVRATALLKPEAMATCFSSTEPSTDGGQRRDRDRHAGRHHRHRREARSSNKWLSAPIREAEQHAGGDDHRARWSAASAGRCARPAGP